MDSISIPPKLGAQLTGSPNELEEKRWHYYGMLLEKKHKIIFIIPDVGKSYG